MNWLDLFIVLFIIIFLIISIKHGFMKSLLSHFSFSVNALISFFLYKPIQSFLNFCGLGNAIASHYSTSLIEKSADFAENLISFSSKSELSSFVSSTIDKGNFNFISKTMFKTCINKSSLYDTLQNSGLESRTLAQIISESYSTFFTTIIAFIISILLIYGIVMLFRLLADKLRQIGFVKVVDGILGVVYGLFRCLIIFIIICFIIKLLSPFEFMTSITNYINGSFFGKLIYSQINNFMDNYLNFSEIIAKLF